MLSMKSLLFTLLFVSACAEAQAARLRCTSASRHTFFRAELDSSNYATEEFFDLKDAELRVEFAVASNLRCAGHSLGETISCVGHWFDQADQLVEFQIQEQDGQLVGTIHNLVRSKDTGLIDSRRKFVCGID